MLAILAAKTNSANPPGPGTGLWIIVGVLAAVIVGGLLLHLLIARRHRAAKNPSTEPRFERDVQPHPKAPPLESIESRR